MKKLLNSKGGLKESEKKVLKLNKRQTLSINARIKKTGKKYPKLKIKKPLRPFSVVEDSPTAIDQLRIIGINAGVNAARKIKAAGLSRIYLRADNVLVSISSSGAETTIPGKLNPSNYYVKYKSGRVLNGSKK